MLKTHYKSYVLPLIAFAQFTGTSLWFASNAVINDIIGEYGLGPGIVGHVTSAVQAGFIAGTLLFAVFTISDRFQPSKVFFISALAGALFNLCMLLPGGVVTIVGSRLLTGFCLAGIYPIGIKIASDYYDKGLGKALGYLVGALVLGTALPHLLKGMTVSLPWQFVIISTSALSFAGGLLVLFFIPEGPFRLSGAKPDFSTFFRVFGDRNFRSATFGYFGHMWELYTFWAFIPIILSTYIHRHPEINLNISYLSFFIIAIGAMACAFGGYISLRVGSAKTAFFALLISCLCCILSPLFFSLPYFIFLAVLVLWGMAVIADSPQFSTLVAASAPSSTKGTALTIGYSIGFFITIISIQSVNFLATIIDPSYLYLFLAPGPLLGLIAMRRLVFSRASPV